MPILPSIYLRDGSAVLLNAERKEEPLKEGALVLARNLSVVGEIAVIDLNAATDPGSTVNHAIIKELLNVCSFRLGGGIRSAESALDWLDIGVTKVMIGSAASVELLRELPPDRVVVALDVMDDSGQIVIEGRKVNTQRIVASRIRELAPFANEFLVTFAKLQGSLSGFADAQDTLKHLAEVRKELGDRITITVSGGVASTADILSVDRLGLRVQVGTALHSEKLMLGDVVAAFLHSDRPDNLFPTVVVDEQGVALGLVYSNNYTIREAVARRKGIYHSRTRGLWEKGLTSGATQDLIRVDLDCDRDALRYTVHQHGAGFCHLNRRTCWDHDKGLGALFRTLESRRDHPVPNSYTNRLLNDRALLASKLEEEAGELIEATDPTDIAWEAADVLYFASVMCVRAGVPLSAVETMLENRSRRVRRRKGDAKPAKPESQQKS